MNGSVAKEVVRAEEPGTEFRSIWTVLRHVPFQQGWLDVKGCRIRYLRSGPSEAPKVIMLAGTGGHAETFVANLGALGKQYDCWAVDIPGCGYSDKPEGSYDSCRTARFVKDLAQVIDATTIDLIGCSVGSWSALRCAFEYPELVRRLVLVSPAGGPLPEPTDSWYSMWTDRNMLGDLRQLRMEFARTPTWEAAKAVLTDLIPDQRRLPEDIIAARFDVTRQPGAADVADKVYWSWDYEVRQQNTFSRAQLRSIRHPVLGICEAQDRTLALVEAMFEALPNGRLIRVDGVGHWPHYEAPDQFNGWALEFLNA